MPAVGPHVLLDSTDAFLPFARGTPISIGHLWIKYVSIRPRFATFIIAFIKNSSLYMTPEKQKLGISFEFDNYFWLLKRMSLCAIQ